MNSPLVFPLLSGCKHCFSVNGLDKTAKALGHRPPLTWNLALPIDESLESMLTVSSKDSEA